MEELKTIKEAIAFARKRSIEESEHHDLKTLEVCHALAVEIPSALDEALAAVSALEEQMKALTADRDNLRNFIEALVEDVCWGQGLPDDIDGGSVQDLAEKYNILKPVPHPEPCHVERCPCIESGPYDFIYHFAWSMPETC